MPVVGWVSLVFWPAIFALPVVITVTVITLLILRRWGLLALAVLTMPTTLFMGQAAADYITGRGVLRTYGLPRARIANVDPTYRCPRASSGCRVYGDEWITQGSYNVMLKTLITTFGPMPGAYTGPYPTEEQSFAAAQRGQPLDLAAVFDDRLVFGDQSVSLKPGTGRLLFHFAFDMPVESWAEAQGAMFDGMMFAGDAVVWEQTCIIVRFDPPPHYVLDEQDHELPSTLIVIDAGTGQPIAYYGLQADATRIAPVWWGGSRDDD